MLLNYCEGFIKSLFFLNRLTLKTSEKKPAPAGFKRSLWCSESPVAPGKLKQDTF